MESITITSQVQTLTSMETAFMVQQERFRNSWWLIITILLLGACAEKPLMPPIPNIYIWESDKNLHRQNGYLLYESTPFSGKLINLYSEKDTASITPYWQGKEHGWALQKYPNGTLKEERFYQKGWKEGVHKGWWENGNPRFVYHFKSDVYEGNLRDWYTNGQVFRDFNYEKGQESGTQRAWFENGKIKSNYQVINGRTYGLLGVKNCKSVVE